MRELEQPGLRRRWLCCHLGRNACPGALGPAIQRVDLYAAVLSEQPTSTGASTQGLRPRRRAVAYAIAGAVRFDIGHRGRCWAPRDGDRRQRASTRRPMFTVARRGPAAVAPLRLAPALRPSALPKLLGNWPANARSRACARWRPCRTTARPTTCHHRTSLLDSGRPAPRPRGDRLYARGDRGATPSPTRARRTRKTRGRVMRMWGPSRRKRLHDHRGRRRLRPGLVARQRQGRLAGGSDCGRPAVGMGCRSNSPNRRVPAASAPPKRSPSTKPAGCCSASRRIPRRHESRLTMPHLPADQDPRHLHARRHQHGRVLPPGGPAGGRAGAGPAREARDRLLLRVIGSRDPYGKYTDRHGRRDVEHQARPCSSSKSRGTITTSTIASARSRSTNL